MRTATRCAALSVLLLALVLASCATTKPAPFAHDASPDLYKLVFENDAIRILEANYGAGDRSEVLYHLPGVLIFATPGSQWTSTDADGMTIETPVVPVNASCFGGGVASHHNISDVPVKLFVIHVKSAEGNDNFCPES